MAEQVRVFVQSTKVPELRFEVLKYDKATGQGVLKGDLGVEFTRDISKPQLEKWGYKLVRERAPVAG